MEDFLLIQNNEDGSCTCGQMPVRIKTMLAYLEKVLGLRPDSSMDIPFPMQMLSATCFDHPIGTQLTMEQMNRVNHYSMSSDWDCCCEDFSEFVENKAVKLREPRFCSFYLETGIDEYDNGYGYGVFEFSRTYDEGPRITVPLALVLESGAVWGGAPIIFDSFSCGGCVSRLCRPVPLDGAVDINVLMPLLSTIEQNEGRNQMIDNKPFAMFFNASPRTDGNSELSHGRKEVTANDWAGFHSECRRHRCGRVYRSCGR